MTTLADLTDLQLLKNSRRYKTKTNLSQWTRLMASLWYKMISDIVIGWSTGIRTSAYHVCGFLATRASCPVPWLPRSAVCPCTLPLGAAAPWFLRQEGGGVALDWVGTLTLLPPRRAHEAGGGTFVVVCAPNPPGNPVGPILHCFFGSKPTQTGKTRQNTACLG